jgi:hypothetical protein
MKTVIAIALLAFTLTTPALATDPKLTTPNKSIDAGMDEARDKAEIAFAGEQSYSPYGEKRRSQG